MTIRKIGVTGASGFVGQCLVAWLAKSNFQVVAYQRNIQHPLHPSNVEIRSYQLGVALNPNHYNDIDCLVHLAFEFNPKFLGNEDENVLGAKELLKLNIPILFISSFSAIPPAVKSYYGQTKALLEIVFKSHCIIRPGLIVGQGGVFKTIFKQVRYYPFLPLFKGGKQPIQIIHIDDFCECLTECIRKYNVQLYHIAHPEIISYRDFIQAMTTYSNRRVCLIPLPVSWMMKLLKWVKRLRWVKLSDDNIKGLIEAKSIDTTLEFEFFKSKWLSPLNAIKSVLLAKSHL